jgi:hypothetical protein
LNLCLTQSPIRTVFNAGLNGVKNKKLNVENGEFGDGSSTQRKTWKKNNAVGVNLNKLVFGVTSSHFIYEDKTLKTAGRNHVNYYNLFQERTIKRSWIKFTRISNSLPKCICGIWWWTTCLSVCLPWKLLLLR